MTGQRETTPPPATDRRRSWRDRFCATPPRFTAVRERLLDESEPERQRHDADLERAAGRIVLVDFSLVPALARAAEYSRHLAGMATEADESALTDRIRRQAVLYDPAKTIEILVGESALRYPQCPPRIRRAQSARLTAMLCLRRVRLGIIPKNAELPTITEHGYSVFDDKVVVDINHTQVTITDPRDVALYERITAALWRSALAGDAARALLRRTGR